MTTVESPGQRRLREYEVLGRVVSVLCNTPAPLSECLGFRLWPRLHPEGGFVLSWHGHPGTIAVIEYLDNAAADDDMTLDLRPGDVQVVAAPTIDMVIVRGVAFVLQPEPMLSPGNFAAMGEFWRTGSLEDFTRAIARSFDA